ncbi:MAG TPA: hypothetical protein VN248_02650, partial [Arenimonas sp.]|nr:hypothetical protein [Arenimonas sp.]
MTGKKAGLADCVKTLLRRPTKTPRLARGVFFSGFCFSRYGISRDKSACHASNAIIRAVPRMFMALFR